MNYLFNFTQFITNLADNSRTIHYIDEYEKLHGPFPEEFKNQLIEPYNTELAIKEYEQQHQSLPVDLKNKLIEANSKKEIVLNYEKAYKKIPDAFQKTFIYRSYISKFKLTDDELSLFAIPDELAEDFDWKLLISLVAASFSSEYGFSLTKDGKVELKITVGSEKNTIALPNDAAPIKMKDYLLQNDFKYLNPEDLELHLQINANKLDTILLPGKTYQYNVEVRKTLNELWSFQIHRLYEIYIEEQMNLFSLIKMEEKEADAIQHQQMIRYDNFLSLKKKIFNKINEIKKTEDLLEL